MSKAITIKVKELDLMFKAVNIDWIGLKEKKLTLENTMYVTDFMNFFDAHADVLNELYLFIKNNSIIEKDKDGNIIKKEIKEEAKKELIEKLEKEVEFIGKLIINGNTTDVFSAKELFPFNKVLEII